MGVVVQRIDRDLPASAPTAPPGLAVGPLSVEVVSDPAGVEALGPAWREMVHDRHLFVGPDWVGAWFDGPGVAATPHVLAVRDGLRLVGVLPLAADRGVVTTCGVAEGLVHVDVAAAPERAPDVAAAVVAHLEGEPWRRWRLHRLAEGGALHLALRARAAARPVLERFVGACPYVDHRGDWDGFLRGLSKHHRHEATRQLRRFWDAPGAALRWVRAPAEVDGALDVLFALHRRRFEALGRPSAFDVPASRAFHRALARRLAERDGLLLGVLSADGRPVAAAYGAHARATTSFFNAGIDPDFHRAGAGVVLRCHVLKDAVLGAGRRELDLLEGCQDWKLRWATGVRPVLDVDVFPPTAVGRAHGGLRRLVRALKARAAATAHRAHGPGTSPDEPADPRHCRRLGCPHAPPAPPADPGADD